MTVNKKKIILYTVIVLTIFSIIWSLLDYFGILRLRKMRKCNVTDTLIKKYSKLQNLSEDRKIVLSFTIDDPERQRPFINSILDQTCKVDNIICISTTTGLEQTYIKDMAYIIPAAGEYSVATKIFQPLITENNSGTVVIAVDSDTIYSKDYIFTLYELYEKNPDTLLYGEKFIIASPDMFVRSIMDIDNYDTSFPWLVSNVKKYKMIDEVKSDFNFKLSS